MYEGVIDDPHDEFFIAENKSLQKVLFIFTPPTNFSKKYKHAKKYDFTPGAIGESDRRL